MWTYQPPDSILSYEWFPNASPSNPPYFAFAVGVKDHPVQLLDGADHRVNRFAPAPCVLMITDPCLTH